MNNETELLGKRFIDLSRQANRKGIVIFSDFLNLNEQNILDSVKKELETSYELFGGYEMAERRVVAFLPADLSYDWTYPISCLKLEPAYPKFAEVLTHRDILGSVMNLGLERGKIGDILCEQNRFYLFCKDNITQYLTDSLSRVKHTVMRLESVSEPATEIVPCFVEKSGIISSNRMDNVIACFCNCSRSEAVKLIMGGKVFVNGKEILHNTYLCKAGDILSVRSYGKYIFDGISGETKKGRIKISYRIYS